jgi:hypothetical protein
MSRAERESGSARLRRPTGGTLVEELFSSFWMAGFECASQVQIHRGRLDLAAELQHDRFCDEDYGMLAPFGFRTVRDGIRWYLIEQQPGRFDWSSVDPLRLSAERHGLQVIWDICHYGWPDDVDPLRADFGARLARLAGAFARYIKDHSAAVPYYVPLVEVSFLAQAVGEWGIFSPFGKGRAYEAKRNLARAAIAVIEAIWQVDPRARILHTEPLVHFAAPADSPSMQREAEALNAGRFEALDMICGRLEPQIGGQARYLDILGLNYYPFSEWNVNHCSLVRFDPRWVDLSDLLAEAYARYQRPFVIAETTGVGVWRGRWLEYVAAEAARTLARGMPLHGVCLYPITNAPDWDTGELKAYGLWDLEPQAGGRLARVLSIPTAHALRSAQRLLSPD